LVFHSSTITKTHGPINISLILYLQQFKIYVNGSVYSHIKIYSHINFLIRSLLFSIFFLEVYYLKPFLSLRICTNIVYFRLSWTWFILCLKRNVFGGQSKTSTALSYEHQSRK